LSIIPAAGFTSAGVHPEPPPGPIGISRLVPLGKGSDGYGSEEEGKERERERERERREEVERECGTGTEAKPVSSYFSFAFMKQHFYGSNSEISKL
jgi:hypothetical protein